MSGTSISIGREALVSALIAAAEEVAEHTQIVQCDGIVIDRYEAPTVVWWDVYETDQAGALARHELAVVEGALGIPLDSCLVETVTICRPSPVFPGTRRVTFSRYCNVFTEEVPEL